MSSDPTTESSDGSPPETPLRAFLARLFTVALLIIVPAMVIHIGFRWASVREPTTALLLSGDGSLDGASIVVTPISIYGPVLKTSLAQADGWQAPVLLEPGRYHVTVSHMGRTILDDDCEPNRMMGVRFELPSAVLIKGNLDLAGAKIQIQRRSDGSNAYDGGEIKLTSSNRYRVQIHLRAGDYRAIASNETGELSRQDFTVDRTEKVSVDLSPHATSSSD
jgi:hypothetical protein